MVTHTCDSTTQEAEAGGSELQDNSQPYSKLEVKPVLSYEDEASILGLRMHFAFCVPDTVHSLCMLGVITFMLALGHVVITVQDEVEAYVG